MPSPENFRAAERDWVETVKAENAPTEEQSKSLQMLERRLENLSSTSMTVAQAENYYLGAKYIKENNFDKLDYVQQEFIDEIIRIKEEHLVEAA